MASNRLEQRLYTHSTVHSLSVEVPLVCVFWRERDKHTRLLWGKFVSLKRKRERETAFLSAFPLAPPFLAVFISLKDTLIVCLMIVVFVKQGLALAWRSVWWKTPICVCVFMRWCLQGCMLSLCQAQLFLCSSTCGRIVEIVPFSVSVSLSAYHCFCTWQ